MSVITIAERDEKLTFMEQELMDPQTLSEPQHTTHYARNGFHRCFKGKHVGRIMLGSKAGSVFTEVVYLRFSINAKNVEK
jgi:hypothetical protein